MKRKSNARYVLRSIIHTRVKWEIPAVNRIIVGLKCETGVNYNFDRYLLGLNVSYLPSFIKPNKDFIAHDRTFTVGILLGYRL